MRGGANGARPNMDFGPTNYLPPYRHHLNSGYMQMPGNMHHMQVARQIPPSETVVDTNANAQGHVGNFKEKYPASGK